MAADRWSLTPAERAARRERVRRRVEARVRNGVIELGPVDRRYRIYDPGGGGRLAKILRTGNPYESTVLADMATLGLTGTAVDVGANVGNHALWLAVVCGLQVEAFEPLTDNLQPLRASVALNGLQDRITVHDVALGAADGTAQHVGRGQLSPDGDLPVRRLDDYRLDDVSLLKIDVEGMEDQVIRGGLETVRRCRPVIYAEAWDDSYSARTGELLEPLGYRPVKRLKWHQQRWDPQ